MFYFEFLQVISNVFLSLHILSKYDGMESHPVDLETQLIVIGSNLITNRSDSNLFVSMNFINPELTPKDRSVYNEVTCLLCKITFVSVSWYKSFVWPEDQIKMKRSMLRHLMPHLWLPQTIELICIPWRYIQIYRCVLYCVHFLRSKIHIIIYC